MSEQIDDSIDIMDLDDDAFEARLTELDAQMEDNKENDGDEDEFHALLEQKTEVHKRKQVAKEQRETRQKGVREALTDYRAEATRLETKLATELDPGGEAELRARQEYVVTRRSELEASLPFGGIPTATLGGRLEDAEYQREELRAKLDAIHAPNTKPSAHARRLQAELQALDNGKRALTVELETRGLQEANRVLAHAAAIRHAERELRAEDAKTISEAEEGRKGTKTEALAETFAARLSLRIPETERRLWKEAEGNVVRAYMSPGGGVDVGGRVRDQKAREDEAKLAAWRKRYEQATDSR